jgi:hypothetical protein
MGGKGERKGATDELVGGASGATAVVSARDAATGNAMPTRISDAEMAIGVAANAVF